MKARLRAGNTKLSAITSPARWKARPANPAETRQWTAGRASPGHHHILDDVHDEPRTAVEDDDVYANDPPLIGRRARRKLALKFGRKRLQLLLQAGRERTVALELSFEPRRKVAAALGETRGQAGASSVEIVDNDFAILLGKDDPLSRAVVALVRVPFALSFALPLSLGEAPSRKQRQGKQQNQESANVSRVHESSFTAKHDSTLRAHFPIGRFGGVC